MPLNYGILEETWTDKEVNLNHMHTFGCISYVHIELRRRSKLDPNSKRRIFIGYRTDEYGYHFWDPENRKILRHKDMIFNEQKTYKDLLTESSTSENDLRVAPQSTPKKQSVADFESSNLKMLQWIRLRTFPRGM